MKKSDLVPFLRKISVSHSIAVNWYNFADITNKFFVNCHANDRRTLVYATRLPQERQFYISRMITMKVNRIINTGNGYK